VTALTVHHRLDQGRALSHDKRSSAAPGLADQIRRYAQNSLGPRFLGVEMISTPGTRGLGIAVFRFEPWPGGERTADEHDRRQLVADFMASLERGRRW